MYGYIVDRSAINSELSSKLNALLAKNRISGNMVEIKNGQSIDSTSINQSLANDTKTIVAIGNDEVFESTIATASQLKPNASLCFGYIPVVYKPTVSEIAKKLGLLNLEQSIEVLRCRRVREFNLLKFDRTVIFEQKSLELATQTEIKLNINQELNITADITRLSFHNVSEDPYYPRDCIQVVAYCRAEHEKKPSIIKKIGKLQLDLSGEEELILRLPAKSATLETSGKVKLANSTTALLVSKLTIESLKRPTKVIVAKKTHDKF